MNSSVLCHLQIAILLCALTGCRHPVLTARTREHARAELAARSAAVFPVALLYKPAVSVPENLARNLAPLFLLKTDPQVTLPAIPLCVYAEEREVNAGGQPHGQVTFLWCGIPRRGRDAKPVPGGVRITLNSAGHPVLWEVLAQAGLHPIFVARSLEEAAARRFGPPLPGRTFSIESDAPGDTRFAVISLVEDGPVPMGPIIYLTGDGEISTILCRCSPAQVERIIGSQSYELVPVSSLEELTARHAPATCPRSRVRELITSNRCPPFGELRLPETF